MPFDPNFYSQSSIRAGIPIVARDSSKSHPWNLISEYRKPELVLAKTYPRFVAQDATPIETRRKFTHVNTTVLDSTDPDHKPVVDDSFFLPDWTNTARLEVKLRYLVAFYDPDFYYPTDPSNSDIAWRVENEEDFYSYAETVRINWSVEFSQLEDGDTWAGPTYQADDGFVDQAIAFPMYRQTFSPGIMNMSITARSDQSDYGNKNGVFYDRDLGYETRSNWNGSFPSLSWDQDRPCAVKLTPSVASSDIDYRRPGSSKGPATLFLQLTAFSLYYHRI